MPQEPDEKTLTRYEVADLCGICIRTLWKWIKAGDIPKPTRLGHPVCGKLIWPQKIITTWIGHGCPKKMLKRSNRIRERIAARETGTGNVQAEVQVCEVEKVERMREKLEGIGIGPYEPEA